MTYEQIIAKIADAYGDGWELERYAKDLNGQHGDTLAGFIAREISETYDPNGTDADQIETARRAIETAIADLSGVYDRLTALGEKVTS